MMNGIDIKEYEKKDSILFNSYSRLNTKVLSNMYPCELWYEGLRFHSSEQLYFWQLMDGNDLGREMIMNARDAKEAKKIGGKILKECGWSGKSEECQRLKVKALRIAIGVKMECCDEFRNLVMMSGDKKIVEYAWWGDDTFGCVDVDMEKKRNWYDGVVRGQNVCGRLIMEWRKKWRARLVA